MNMSTETIAQQWDDYLNAYRDVTVGERGRLLRGCAADDIVFSNPMGPEGRGLANLIEHVAQFQARNPGGYFESTELLVHHGQLLSSWTMCKADGSPLAKGHTYARFDERGQLVHTAGFWKV
jgi:hypothetical protein